MLQIGDLILSENFISETLKFGFDKTSYRAKLYDISIVESEKLHEEGYEISVRWSEKRRGEFFHYINSSEIQFILVIPFAPTFIKSSFKVIGI